MELATYCEQEQITFTRGRPRKSNDQCYVEQKNGQIVRQVVGYDRFTGELAYRQLTELYRALRVYVNGFQPSMKLQTKQRDGSKVHRTYDQAQTPIQRLLASDILPPKKQQELLQIIEALDPLRLLQQLEHLQKALWQHAVISEAPLPASPLQFEIKQCTEERVPVNGIPGTPPSLLQQARKRKYQKSGRPRDWRTRDDPYEGLWEQITAWLTVNPERTGVDIFQELQSLYPGRYRPTQLRTLQRGLQKIRARLLVTFDDQWGDNMLNSSLPELRAEVIAEIS